MANVTFEKTGPVTGRIQLSFSKEELSNKLNEELRKESKRVNIKGFRKGKTPLSALRKLMGNQVFGPLLDRTIQEELFGYIEENDVKLIFSPVPDESVPVEQISASNIKDLNLAYDLGLEPDFELTMPTTSFTKYTLDTDETFLQEQVDNLRKQRGESQTIEEGPIEREDILDVTFREVDGDISNSAKLYVDNLTEEYREQFVGQERGFELTVEDLAGLEPNATPEYVNKYFLELEDDATDLSGKTFTVTVDGISRIVPAELDEAFFVQFDPTGGVKSEEDLRAKIATDNAKGFEQQGISMANFEIQRALVEGHDFPVPTELMKKLSKEDTEESFELFERGVRWMLIRNKVAASKNIELEYEDVRAEALASLMQMLGGQRPDFLTDEFLENYIQNMLKDEKQREELSSNALEKKIMAAIRQDVTLVEQPISSDDFNEVIRKFNEENTPATATQEEE